ncbi:MAG: AmmeMemoRadiSam system protein B [Calditrichia bacterium]
MEEQIREPGFSGKYYPADEIQAGREISLLLESSPELNLSQPPRAVIIPHDSLSRSGGVAARAVRPLLEYRYRRLVIITPSHAEEFPFVSIFSGKAYQTSLGTVEVDAQLCTKLAEYDPEIALTEKGHSSGEVGIEAALPFFQWAFGNFRVVPISMGLQSQFQIEQLSKAIIHTVPPENTLLVASSNFGYRLPEAKVREQLQLAASLLETMDEETFWDHVVAHKIDLCGYGAVLTVLAVAQKWGARHSRVLLNRTSADIDGNSGEATGYLSAIFY